MDLRWQQYIGQLFYLWLGFSLVVLFYPGTGQAGLPYIDKVVHFVLFGVLFVLARLKWTNQVRGVWFGVLLYMIAAELVQHFFVPGRSAEIGDVIAGFLGAGVAHYLFNLKVK